MRTFDASVALVRRAHPLRAEDPVPGWHDARGVRRLNTVLFSAYASHDRDSDDIPDGKSREDVHEAGSIKDSYLATTFRVESPDGHIDIRVGEKHPRIDALLSHHNATEWAYITAWNPASQSVSADINAAAHSELIDRVGKHPWPFYEGEGIPDNPVVPEELGRQVLRLVQNPDGQDLLIVGQIEDACLEFAPELGAPVRRADAEREGEASVQIEAAEVGLRDIDHLVAVRVQGVRDGAQDAGLADTGLAGQKPEPWAMQEPLEALAQRRMRAVVPELSAGIAGVATSCALAMVVALINKPLAITKLRQSFMGSREQWNRKPG